MTIFTPCLSVFTVVTYIGKPNGPIGINQYFINNTLTALFGVYHMAYVKSNEVNITNLNDNQNIQNRTKYLITYHGY